MTVVELLAAILRAYPGSNPESLSAYRAVFFTRFKMREGEHLQAAYEATLAEFKPTARQPFPIPADFEKHMPSKAIDLPDDGPKLDFGSRNQKAEELYRRWRAEQAPRAANGIPEIMKALEQVAYPLALVQGWNPKADRLLLTRKQVRTAIQSAISIERRKRHGPLDRLSNQAWWDQVKAIADEWRIEITPEWWSKGVADALTPKAEAA